MTDRRRQHVGVSTAACGLCGAADLPIVESRRVRSGMDVVNPFWRAHPRTYALCPSCGARIGVEELHLS